MSKLFLFLLIALSVSLHNAVTVQDIDGAIRHLTRAAPRSNPMQTDPAMRREVAVSVHAASLAFSVDPWLVIVIIEGESSFKPWSNGADGEVGLMQVNDHVRNECLADEFDMGAIQDQITCGTRHLSRCTKKWGSELAGLIDYASGHYGQHTERTERKMRARLRLAYVLASKPWED